MAAVDELLDEQVLTAETTECQNAIQPVEQTAQGLQRQRGFRMLRVSTGRAARKTKRGREAQGIAMLANARAAAVVEPARADRDVDSRDAEVRLASSPSFQAARVERINAVEHENVVVSRSSLNPTCPTYRC